MNATIKEMLEKEHRGVWDFCARLEELGDPTNPMEVRGMQMLSQGLRDWASNRGSALTAYENLRKEAEYNISDIRNNLTILRSIDTRAEGYNAKCEENVGIARTAAYILEIENETLIAVFKKISTLAFGSEVK